MWNVPAPFQRSFVSGCHTKSFDRGHTNFEQHVNKLKGSGHMLKRRLLALCQFILKPKHVPDRDLAPTKGSRIHPCKRSTALVGAMSLARAVSDESLSREILKTVAELLKKPALEYLES